MLNFCWAIESLFVMNFRMPQLVGFGSGVLDLTGKKVDNF